MANRFYNNQSSSAAGQLFNPRPGSYLERTSRPIFSLAYLALFILIYEAAVIFFNTDVFSKPIDDIPGLVVSFAWVHSLMTKIGFSNKLAWVGPPFAVIVILLAMQATSNTKPKVRIKDFLPITLECICWAFPLIVLSLMINKVLPDQQTLQIPEQSACLLSSSSLPVSDLVFNVVTGIGAGIYEELIFRLFLMCLLMLFFQDILGFSKGNSVLFSILISSFLFSLHHHVYYLGGSFVIKEDAIGIAPFIFRMLAGGYLAVLFAARGFGVAAATHAYHNVMAAVMNHVLFASNVE